MAGKGDVGGAGGDGAEGEEVVPCAVYGGGGGTFVWGVGPERVNEAEVGEGKVAYGRGDWSCIVFLFGSHRGSLGEQGRLTWGIEPVVALSIGFILAGQSGEGKSHENSQEAR